MKNKFDFYEIVKIVSSDPVYKEINNKDAVVIGMDCNEHGWSYAIEVDDDGWAIEEKFLEKTGKFSKREEFYPDTLSVKVIVDESGKGKLADESSDSENL